MKANEGFEPSSSRHHAKSALHCTSSPRTLPPVVFFSTCLDTGRSIVRSSTKQALTANCCFYGILTHTLLIDNQML